jgi:3-methyladenine DNA glycosylase AlkD
VDSSAPQIVGAHLESGDRSLLERLARSESLWERRIAILATQHFIRRGDFGTTLTIAEMLVDDRHDLIHKAVGWMLREVGNRDRAAEEGFLRRHHRTMPRTMLRYAIEKFPPDLRQAYLRGEMGPESAH